MNKFCFLVLVLLSSSLFATDVSGDISGVWTLNQSPFNVIGDISVTDSLIIEPGVNVIVNGNYRINVLGWIIAEGTQNDSIIFAASDINVDWVGIRLEGDSEINRFSYCRIVGTGGTNSCGIKVVSSPVEIDHCLIADHDKGIDLFAVGVDNPPEMIVRYTIVRDIFNAGVTIAENGSVVIEDSDISKCALSGSWYGGIHLTVQTQGATVNPIIRRNTIHHNNRQGMIISDIMGVGNVNPEIYNNLVQFNFTGIYSANTSGFYHNNMIMYNYVPGDANSGAGIMCAGARSMAVFADNSISQNYAGIYIANDARPNLGNITNFSVEDDGNNSIHDNAMDGVTNAIVTSSTQNIYAQNNSWDSFDTAEISQTIHELGSGQVIFMPLASGARSSIMGNVTYSGVNTPDSVLLTIYRADSLSVPIVYSVSTTDTYFASVPGPGEYYVTAEAVFAEDVPDGYGIYGGLLNPQTVTVQDSTISNVNLSIIEDNPVINVTVGSPELFQGIMSYPVAFGARVHTGFVKFLQSNPQEITVNGVLMERDSTRIFDYTIINTIVTECRFNPSAGDVWGYSMIDGDDARLVQGEYVLSESITVNNQQDMADIVNITENGILRQQIWYSDNFGYYRMKMFEYVNGTPYLMDYFKLKTFNVTLNGDDFLVTGNKWIFSELKPDHPTDLIVKPQTGNIYKLMWSPPIYSSSENWDGYRVYDDGTLVTTLTMDNLSFETSVTSNADFYVVAYNAQTESERTNIKSIRLTDSDNDINVKEQYSAFNYPNPFNPTTIIKFNNVKKQLVNVSIYNIKGQKVKQLSEDVMEKGVNELVWKGIDDEGKNVGSGVYFYRITTPDIKLDRKMLLLK